jgi:hypothetical protein
MHITDRGSLLRDLICMTCNWSTTGHGSPDALSRCEEMINRSGLRHRGDKPGYVREGATVRTRIKPSMQFLFVCLLLAYSIYAIRRLEPGFTFAKYDCGWLVTTVISLSQDGDLDLRNQLNNDPAEADLQTSMGLKGQWYPVHEYLIAFPTVPFYLLMGIPGCLIFNVLVVILLMMFLYGLCCRHVDEKSAFIAVVLTGFTTLFYEYSYSYSGDVFGACLLVAAYWCIVTRKPCWGGLLWGLSVFARIPNLVTAPAFVVFLLLMDMSGEISGNLRLLPLWKRWARQLARFTVGILPVMFGFGLANWLMFGSPLATSYSRWQVFEGGRAVLKSQGTAFTASLIDQLPGVLFNPTQGLFFGAPLLLVAFAFGLRLFWRRSRSETVLFMTISVALIVLFSKYSIANAGYPGNRYLMSVVALGAIPLSLAISEALKNGDGIAKS